jgi:hypothetical protein
MKVKTFITHKKGETIAECADAYAVGAADGAGAVAVADGVSQSLYPGEWAKLLVNACVADAAFTLQRDECLSPLRREWLARFTERLEAKRAEDDPMLCYLEIFFIEERSAGATLLGVRVKDAHTVTYEVLGDTCLIVVRGGVIVQVIGSNDGFTDFPDYVDSHQRRGMKGTPRTGTVDDLATGDRLLLATDALAAWFDAARQKPDCGRTLVEAADRLTSQRDFETFVDRLRTDGMADDDTTLVCIEWDADDTACVIQDQTVTAKRHRHGRHRRNR